MKKINFIILGLIVSIIFGLYIVNSSSNTNYEKLTLQVKIPCPGHSGLIISQLENLEGVKNVEFKLPNLFEVSYNPNKINKEKLLNLNIFKEYEASIIK
ncbi:MAG: hypothetical protein PHF86_14505 [Candidatus Nanoarchaeia archaeon]|nr:hypothetical protein [Candidatus Nanoarchaeia archaeon]